MLGSDAYRRRIEKVIRAGNRARPSLDAMSLLQPSSVATTRSRPPVRTALALLVTATALAGGAGCGVLADPAGPTTPLRATAPVVTPAPVHPVDVPADPAGGKQGARAGAQSVAGGRLPDDVSAVDDEYPGVARLDPALLEALRRASADAEDDGVAITVTSGWRSADYQERLLEDAIATYGSRKQAARWVATPETSPHVSGDAVDLGPSQATTWLARHGAAYGLCRVFDNEPWHFELRPRAATHGCPQRYADPTHDPRMQR